MLMVMPWFLGLVFNRMGFSINSLNIQTQLVYEIAKCHMTFVQTPPPLGNPK